MTSGAPWSVKGIDPRAREIAKDLARRSGMTLGEWLNQMIQEAPETEPAPTPPPRAAPPPRRRRFDQTSFDRPAAPVQRLEAPPSVRDELGRVTEALEQLSSRIEAAEHRSTLAISGIDQSVLGVLSRIEGAERTQNQVAAHFEDAIDEVRADQDSLMERLGHLERERTGARSAEALKSLEQALTRVATHLYEGEGRTRDSLGALRHEVDSLADKLRRVETSNDPDGGAALVEQVVSRIADRLEQAEARTSGALKGLEGSFASLDERLRRAEQHLEAPDAGERRFEVLASELTQRVDQVRNELAERLKSSADSRFDRMEGALREMSGHVQAAEQRSAQAIERMGQDVVRLTDQLGQKVALVESRSADAIGKVSGEMSRIADAMEGRMKRADVAQAEALEKLGGEIARITERLAERISNAERRSAQSMDDVGDQVARVTERLQQRHDRASSELLDRLKQSEERTARLLEEAREKIDQRLAETQKRIAEAAPPAPAAYADPYVSPYTTTAFASEGFQGFALHGYASPFDEAPYELPQAAYESGPQAYDAEPAALEVEPFVDGSEPAYEPEAVDEQVAEVAYDAGPDDSDPMPDVADTPSMETEAHDFGAFAPSASDEQISTGTPAFSEADFAPPEAGFPTAATAEPVTATFLSAEPRGTLGPELLDETPGRNASTRELIAQARAAARAASEAQEKKGKRGGGRDRDADASGSLFSGFGIGRKRKAEGSTLKTALMMSAAAAFLGVGASGVVLMNGGTIAGWGHDQTSGQHDSGSMDVAVKTDQEGPASDAIDPNLALALTPDPTAAPAPPSPEAQALYSQAVTAIDAGDKAGVQPLKRAANLGYAPAQFFLAKLYQDGKATVARDLPEARRWAARAAANGEPRAMHLLGTFYVNGEGGEKNAVAGYEWFKKAAALGFVDSQYNLGMMNEAGMGIAQNAAEGYKWYLIAGQAGDDEARQRAQALRAKLTPAERAVAEKAAVAFRPEEANPSIAAPAIAAPSIAAPVVAAAADVPRQQVVQAQRALSRLGYYQGPSDGTASPALRLAIAAFQRDRGLPANGTLTPDLLQRFAKIER